jgi:PPIC-type PPIASE domain
MRRVVASLALLSTLTLAQTISTQRPDTSAEQSEHRRHDDDDELPPATALRVLPDTPVITIEGVCDRLPPAKSSNGKATEATGSNTSCKTTVTKAEFEKLVEAVNPQMSGPGRRQLAESYPRLLLFAQQARQLGLDQDPRFAEMLRYATVQLLTQRLDQYFEQQAANISDSDVNEYYKQNAAKFERAELMRIFVPRQSRRDQNAPSGAPGNALAEEPMLSVAKSIQARAANGQDFHQLQEQAFEAAGISSGAPNVSMGKISPTGVPINHQQVFTMQPGQVSDVISDGSGYYIYKLVSRQAVPVSQVSKQIRKAIISERMQQSIDLLTKSLKFDLNPMYFGAEGSRQRAAKENNPSEH